MTLLIKHSGSIKNMNILSLIAIFTISLACLSPAHNYFGDQLMTDIDLNTLDLKYRISGNGSAGNNLSVIESTLLISGKERSVQLEKRRSQGDQPGESIGLFRSNVTEELLIKLVNEIRNTNLDNIPEPINSSVNTSVLTLDIKDGEQEYNLALSGGSLNVLEYLETLLFQLDQLSHQLSSRPVAAIATGVVFHQVPTPHFELLLKNIGSQKLYIGDPKLMAQDLDSHQWAGVMVAAYPEEVPGFTAPPLEWEYISLEVSEEEKDENLLIEAGQTISARTVPWNSYVKNSRYLAIGLYSNYEGEEKIDEIPRIRGAVFSQDLTFK